VNLMENLLFLRQRSALAYAADCGHLCHNLGSYFQG
jgi:hypothetical protein